MAKKKVTSKSKKAKKTSTQLMQETFVMVAFSFIGGTALSAGFLWFVGTQLYTPAGSVNNSALEEEESMLENVHYDSSEVTQEDYDLIDYLVLIESALGEYCSGANLDPDATVEPRCPTNLEELIPDYIENEEDVGGDLNVFTYAFEGQEFEIDVKLGNGSKEIMENDGGDNDLMYELGTKLTLIK